MVTRRILEKFQMNEISAVDVPAQMPARMTIMKRHTESDDADTRRRKINAHAKQDPEMDQSTDAGDETDDPSNGSTRFRHLGKGDATMSAWNVITKKAAEGETISKHDIHGVFVEHAALIRRSEPALSDAQAYLKAFADPANANLRKLHQMVPNVAPIKAPEPVAKRDTGSAMRELNEKAEEHRRAHPKLTHAQAFSAVYGDPANAHLRARHKMEMRTTPPDAA